VLDPMMPAAFQYIDKPDQVGIDIGLGIGQRISHPGLCGQIDHHFDCVVPEDRVKVVRMARSVR
jgi:hypothetical protein